MQTRLSATLQVEACPSCPFSCKQSWKFTTSTVFVLQDHKRSSDDNYDCSENQIPKKSNNVCTLAGVGKTRTGQRFFLASDIIFAWPAKTKASRESLSICQINVSIKSMELFTL